VEEEGNRMDDIERMETKILVWSGWMIAKNLDGQIHNAIGGLHSGYGGAFGGSLLLLFNNGLIHCRCPSYIFRL
jgi:hypothetical protein